MPNDYYTMLYTGEKTDELLQRVDEGEIILPDGTVAASGHARYMKQPLSVIGDPSDASNDDIWELIESPDDPTEIDIPELKK